MYKMVFKLALPYLCDLCPNFVSERSRYSLRSDLFINKLKTKFNNLFLQNDFKYKKNSQLLLKKFPARAKQMPSKVLFVGKKKRRPRPFGNYAPEL